MFPIFSEPSPAAVRIKRFVNSLTEAEQTNLLIGINPTYVGNTLKKATESKISTGSTPHTWGIRFNAFT